MNLKTILAFLCGRNRKKELYDMKILRDKIKYSQSTWDLVWSSQDAVGMKRVQNDMIKFNRELSQKKKRYEEAWGKVEL